MERDRNRHRPHRVMEMEEKSVLEKLAMDRDKENGGRETFRHRLGETRESPRGAGGERQPASPRPRTSLPWSPSRKRSSYLMMLSCRGGLHESPMLVSDLASARKFMGWPGTAGQGAKRTGIGGRPGRGGPA